MTEPQAAPARSLEMQIAEDLGKKAGRDAVETILRTLRLTDSQLIRLAAGVSASTSVLAIPLAVMMQRRDKSPEEVVEALLDMVRPQLIGAVGHVRQGRH